jgi:methyl-accepting chemotaxis protein
MNSTTVPLPDAPPTAELAARGNGLRWKLGVAGALGAAALLAWQGGAWGVLAVAAVALAAWQLMRHGLVPQGGETDTADDRTGTAPKVGPAAGRVGAEVMVSQVVPVWSRQMDVTRTVATDGLAKLLENFAGVSGALDDLSRGLESFSPTAAPGAVDDAVSAQSPAIDALLAPSTRAFRQRDDMVAVLGRCADTLSELQLQAKTAHEISRHTRLVAFNASIEAHRGSNGGTGSNGSQAIANELRDLASRMATTGEAVHSLVGKLLQSVNLARRTGEIDDTTPDELRLELQIQARTALTTLLSTLGTSLASTRAMKETSDTLRSQLDEAFVNFQFGDRVSQMLSIVGNDMSNFASWVARHPHATQTDAAEWLESLDASYTMEEQRAQHHGNVHIDRGSEIEFF